jgi:hypothetical protein
MRSTTISASTRPIIAWMGKTGLSSLTKSAMLAALTKPSARRM